MAEYLSPGVYVEEFDSGSKPMEGVGTSTAGFLGLAQRGPTVGVPQLVTNFGDFTRQYGGYLSENEFGEYRYLSYAVENFFVNGGSRCYVMRVAPTDAAVAVGYLPDADNAVIKVTAKNPGEWGNRLQVKFTPSQKAKTNVLEIVEENGKKKYRVKKAAGFRVGDVVSYQSTESEDVVYNKVTVVQDDLLEFETDFDAGIVDQELMPTRTISTCEFNLEVRFEDVVETYENVSFNISESNYVVKRTEKSDLIQLEYVTGEESDEGGDSEEGKDDKKDKKDKKDKNGDGDKILPPLKLLAGDGAGDTINMAFAGGSNGSLDAVTSDVFKGEDKGAGKRTGLEAFVDNDVVSLMAIPGVTDPNVQLNLVAHCENLASRFAVLDMPKELQKTEDLMGHRDIFDSNYAAMYHPWLKVYDPLDKRNISIPPSGSVLGIYARSDNERGVHKAPANEVVKACVGLECNFNKGEQDILNPKGINLIRAFPGQGIRVWGARTASSDTSWKYVNVRRLFIYIEESIKANTNWVVFEPNDETLWVRVQRTIDVFLTGLWRNGSLAGTTKEEAFFVNVDRTTMSQDDIDNGRLICVIGVAPVKPAEFVIFRITQKAGEAE